MVESEFTKDDLTVLDYQKEGVTLEKNSRGYNWKIKILADAAKIGDEDIDRLRKINDGLYKEFGEPNG